MLWLGLKNAGVDAGSRSAERLYRKLADCDLLSAAQRADYMYVGADGGLDGGRPAVLIGARALAGPPNGRRVGHRHLIL